MPHKNHDIGLTTCSQCSERFAAAARFCTYCGADNLGSDTEAAADLAFTAKLNYDIFLLGVPIASVLAIWLWIAPLNVTQSPQTSLVLIVLINLLGTAMAACLEARTLGTRMQGFHQLDPAVWFALIALLWPIAYPLYLYRRANYGASNLLAAGVMLTAIVCGSAAAAGYRQSERQDAMRALLESNPNAGASAKPMQDAAIQKAIAQYGQARKYSSPIEICTKATQVLNLYQEANDLGHYKAWNVIKKTDCSAAGILEQ